MFATSQGLIFLQNPNFYHNCVFLFFHNMELFGNNISDYEKCEEDLDPQQKNHEKFLNILFNLFFSMFVI